MILMAAGFLTGCMETSEDDCIVKEKETETGDSIRSYSSGTEQNRYRQRVPVC